MRSLIPRSRMLAVVLTGAALTLSPLGSQAISANKPADPSTDCFVPPAGAAAKGGRGADTRDMTVAEQKAIEAQTAQLLKAKAARGIGVPKGALAARERPGLHQRDARRGRQR